MPPAKEEITYLIIRLAISLFLFKISEYKSEGAIEEEERVKANFVDLILTKMGLKPVGGNPRDIKNEFVRSIVEEKVRQNMKEIFGVNRGITKLTYGNEIRYNNSYLMNFLTLNNIL